MVKSNLINLLTVVTDCYKALSSEITATVDKLSNCEESKAEAFGYLIELKKHRNALEDFIGDACVYIASHSDADDFVVNIPSSVTDAISFTGMLPIKYFALDRKDIKENLKIAELRFNNRFARYERQVDNKAPRLILDAERKLISEAGIELNDYSILSALYKAENPTPEEKLLKTIFGE